MSTSAEEGVIEACSCEIEKGRGRVSSGHSSLLRLRAGLFAAAVAVLFILGTGAAQRAQAQVESVLHSFTGSDGFDPYAGLIMDPAGNL